MWSWSTNVTDERKVDMRSQDRALHCSASCGKNLWAVASVADCDEFLNYDNLILPLRKFRCLIFGRPYYRSRLCRLWRFVLWRNGTSWLNNGCTLRKHYRKLRDHWNACDALRCIAIHCSANSMVKMAWAINMKLGTHVFYGRSLACIVLEVKGQRSRSEGYEVCCRCGYACQYDCLCFYLNNIFDWGKNGSR